MKSHKFFEVIAIHASNPEEVRTFAVGDYAEKSPRLPKTRREALMIFNESPLIENWCPFLVRETIEQAV